MTFQKGQSGNPRGRPVGSGTAGRVREAMEGRADDILKSLLDLAVAGDPAALRIVMDRICPPLKPVEMPAAVKVPDGASLADIGRAIVEAAAAGKLAPGQAGTMMAGLAALVRVVEVDELERRLAALERGAAP